MSTGDAGRQRAARRGRREDPQPGQQGARRRSTSARVPPVSSSAARATVYAVTCPAARRCRHQVALHVAQGHRHDRVVERRGERGEAGAGQQQPARAVGRVTRASCRPRRSRAPAARTYGRQVAAYAVGRAPRWPSSAAASRAWPPRSRCRGRRPAARVVVLEAGARLGGKVAVSEVGGLPVDEGADSMLARVPDGVALAQDAGLGDELVSPAAGQAALWTRGRLRPLPTGTVMGVPGDLAALARSEVLSPAGLARVLRDLVQPGAPDDRGRRGRRPGRRAASGREVVDRLVDPLLGGVYAGRADRLSLHATLPAAGRAGSPRDAACCWPPGPPAPRPSRYTGPVFRGLPGGLGRLPAAVAARQRRRGPAAHHRPGPGPHARRLAARARLPRRPRVTSTPTPSCSPSPRRRPPGCSARCCPRRRPSSAALEYASVGIVTLVLAGAAARRRQRLPGARRSSGRTTKAVTFTSRKWAHYPRRPVGGPRQRRAVTARPPTCSATTPSWSRSCCDELAQAVGPVGPVARHPGRPLGRRAAAVRRRPPRPGAPGPGRRRRRCPGSRSPARRTTASACRPARAAVAQRPGRCSRQNGAHDRHPA